MGQTEVKGQLRIEHLYAFIVLDEDGTEGVPAMLDPGGSTGFPIMLPMMGADMARVESPKAIIKSDPRLRGKKITLAKFTTRENLEVILIP